MLSLLVAAQCLACTAVSTTTYPVDSAPPLGRRFDGLGALSGGGGTSRLLRDYPPQPLSDLLDYLFLPSFGASLDILKLEIGGEVDSTNGAEPSHKRSPEDLSGQRGYEWWLAAEAKRRNPAVALYALAWGWPGYLRAGQASARTPWTDRALTAEYVTSWVALAASAHNLTVDAVGIWNESGYDLEYIPILRAALDAAGFASTRIIAADMYVGRWSIADALAANATLRRAVWGVGVHYPGAQSTPAAQGLGLPLWASEDNSGGGLGGGACLARAINENYANGLMTSTITWHLASAFYTAVPWFGASLVSAGWPTSGHYEVNYNLWAMAHTAQFTAPGWTYLAHGRGVGYLAGGGTYVALTDGAGNLTLVVEKLDRNTSRCDYSASPYNATAAETAVFQLRGDFAGVQALYAWRSSFTQPASPEALFVPAGVLRPVGGKWVVELAVGDVITLTT
jgi:galactosylceramidase